MEALAGGFKDRKVPAKASIPGLAKASIPGPAKASIPGPAKASIPGPAKASIPIYHIIYFFKRKREYVGWASYPQPILL